MAKREGIMLAYKYDPRRVEGYPKPWLVQPKPDGDRCRAVFDADGKVTLYSSGLTVRNFAVPYVVEELEMLGLRSIELDGELFVLGKPHEWIRGIVSRTVEVHPETDQMEYHIFDLVDSEPQHDRIQKLNYIVEETERIRLVHTYGAEDIEDVEYRYHQFLDQGYEGAIVRHPTAPYVRKKTVTMSKIKPRLSETYEVIGYEEEISIHGERKDSLGALILKDDRGEVFKVGSGFTAWERQEYWREPEELIGKTAKIRFQALTTLRKVPKMQSFVEFVD